MRLWLVIAAHELRRTLADRGATVWMFVMPVAFAAFFGLVMGGQASPSDVRATLSVLDQDGGPVAEALLTALDSDALALQVLDPASPPPPSERVRTLVIPAGFSAGVLAGEPQTLRLEKEPDTNVEAALLAQTRLLAAITRVLARLVEAGEGPSPPDVLAEKEGGSDLVRVEARFAGESRTVPSGFTQSIPGMAVMFVLLVAVTTGAAGLAADRGAGRLRRLATTPAQDRDIVLGLLGGRLVVAAFQVVVLVAVAVAAGALFGLPVGDHPLAMLVVLLVYTAAVAPLGVVVASFIRDPDRAATVGVLATMIMSAFGGCWWPLEVVPPVFQTVALAFPTGWAMQAMHGVISFGQGLDGVLLPLAVLAGFGVAVSAVAFRSLRVG